MVADADELERLPAELVGDGAAAALKIGEGGGRQAGREGGEVVSLAGEASLVRGLYALDHVVEERVVVIVLLGWVARAG